MGTMWEDLGPEAASALANIEDGAYGAADAMEGIKDVKYDDLGSQFEELKRNVETALIPLGEELMPILMELGETVLPLVTSVLIPLVSLVMDILAPILNVISQGIKPLIESLGSLITDAIVPVVSAITGILVPIFSGALGSILDSTSSIIGNVVSIIKSLIDFIKNVFTGNWRAAWTNVKDIFSNIVSGLVTIFKAPMNAIVDGWNSLVKSIGSISIPEWVPVVGGKSFSLPKMTRLKVGLDYVPRDMFPAYLDEGEWVLTKEEASALRAIGGLEGMIGRIDRSMPSVNVNVQGRDQSMDYDRLGNAVVNAMIRSGVGFKCDERVFARLVKDLIEYV